VRSYESNRTRLDGASRHELQGGFGEEGAGREIQMAYFGCLACPMSATA